MAFKKADILPPQLQDASSVNANGYYIRFYVTGTSTPTPVYFNSAGSSSANFVILNTSGLPTNSGTEVDLYFDTSVTYKIIIYQDATTDNPFGPTIDDFNADISMLDTDDTGSVALFVAASHAGDSKYIQSYYGSWAATTAGPKGGHWVHKTGATNAAPTIGTDPGVSSIGTGAQSGYYWDADGNEWRISFNENGVNVYQFGAYGDKTTDDITFLQNAHDFVESHGGGDIRLLEGEFRTSSAFNIYGNTSVIGSGPQVSVIYPDSGVDEPVTIGDVASQSDAHRGVLRGFTVDRETYSAATENGGFVFYWAFGSSCYDLEAREFKYPFWFKPGDAQGVAYMSLYNMNGVGGFYNVFWEPDTGAATPGYANEITFYGGRMLTRAVTDTNIHWNGGSNVRFMGVSCEGSGTQALYLGGTGNSCYQCRTEGTWSADDIVVDAAAIRTYIEQHDFYTTVTDNGIATSYITHNSGSQLANVCGGAGNPTLSLCHESGGADTNFYMESSRWGDTDYSWRAYETATANNAGYLTTQGRMFVRRSYQTDESGSSIPPLILGSYYLWVDSSGRLRIKSGAPTSDTDGTVVGTQT